MKNPFKKGHCYKIYCKHFNLTAIAIYEGREEGYECSVCGKGDNAHGFNIYQGRKEIPTAEEVREYISNVGYETWFYGTEHLPELIEEIL